MIFAAGLGTRLKPLTDTLPKALVPLAGKTLLQWQIERLKAAGITDIVVNVHHFADKIEGWLAEQDWISHEPAEGKMMVQVSDERNLLLETGGAVLHARKYLEGCGHFLIHNVDILSNCDLNWLMTQVRPDALATLLVSNRKSSRYLLFEPDTLRLVGWMNEKTGERRLAGPHVKEEECLKLAFSGIHIMSDGILEVMESYARDRGLYTESDTPRFPVMDFYLSLCHLYNIYGVCSDDLHLVDVGKLDTLAKAEEFIKTL